MTRRATFLIVSVITVLAVLLLAGCAGKQPEGEIRPSAPTAQPNQPTAETRQPSPSGWDLSPRRNDAGRVVIDVQPLKLGDDQETWEFAVALNTHSVDLAYDLMQVAVLRCERGEEYQPLAWDGSPPGGHHRRGVLRFTPLDHRTSFIEIVIRGVAEVPERVFRWEAKPTASAPAAGTTHPNP